MVVKFIHSLLRQVVIVRTSTIYIFSSSLDHNFSCDTVVASIWKLGTISRLTIPVFSWILSSLGILQIAKQ